MYTFTATIMPAPGRRAAPLMGAAGHPVAKPSFPLDNRFHPSYFIFMLIAGHRPEIRRPPAPAHLLRPAAGRH
jgi:hypothetical protein